MSNRDGTDRPCDWQSPHPADIERAAARLQALETGSSTHTRRASGAYLRVACARMSTTCPALDGGGNDGD